MRHGLTATTVAKIHAVLVRFPAVEKAVLYGSRAKGNFKPGSDIDLTLQGAALTSDMRSAIASALDDLLLPYTIDLSLFEELNHAKLREHIERVGVLFYQRAKQGAAMKSGWKTKNLEQVCHFSNGLWKGKQPPFVNVGVIRNTNFTKEGTLDDSNIAYLAVEAKQFEKRRLHLGDIILEKSGGGPKQPVGRVALFDKEGGDFSFSNFTSVLRVNDPRELDYRYLHKFLHWTYLSGVTEGMQSHSTGIRNLDGNAYKSIKITFPALPEQHRIGGILDEAFAGIATAKANAEKNLQNARALFESHLHSEHAEKAYLGDLVEVKTGKLDANAAVEGGQYPFFTCSRDIFAIDKYAFDCEAILLAGNNAVGDFNVKYYKGKFNAYQRTYVITVNAQKRVLYRFLYFQILKSLKKFKAQSVGAGTKFLKLGMIKGLEIALPSLAEQKRIVATMDALREETEHLESIYQRKLAALEELKQALLHQAFAGEL